MVCETSNKPGKLIVFEGAECSGKSTQLNAAADYLIDRGLKIVTTREPGSLWSPLASLGVREFLLNRKKDNREKVIDSKAEALLFCADRAAHLEGFIKPAIAEGFIVLCDRFVDSFVAYQGHGRGCDYVWKLNQIVLGDFKSDLTFWLDVSSATAESRMRSRVNRDRIESELSGFHSTVRNAFLMMFLNGIGQGNDPDDTTRQRFRINADRPVDAVSSDICGKLETALVYWGYKESAKNNIPLDI